MKVTVKKGDYIQAVKYYPTITSTFRALAQARMEHPGSGLTFRAENASAQDRDIRPVQ